MSVSATASAKNFEPGAESIPVQASDQAGASIHGLIERVELLLLRFEEAQRTNALLRSELASVGAERDSLKSRLSAARSRVDALLDRLPAAAVEATTH